MYNDRRSKRGCFSFGEVRRCVFEQASKYLEENEDVKRKVTLDYNGTNLFGVMEMEVSPGESKVYKKALIDISKIVADNA